MACTAVAVACIHDRVENTSAAATLPVLCNDVAAVSCKDTAVTCNADSSPVNNASVADACNAATVQCNGAAVQHIDAAVPCNHDSFKELCYSSLQPRCSARTPVCTSFGLAARQEEVQ